MTQMTTPTASGITFRIPTLNDAKEMIRLAAASRVLDVNSDYAYLLLARDFHDTCVIAEENGRLLGFATAYQPPRDSNVLFVWQIAVSEEARGLGLASQMLDELINRGRALGVQFIEATVTGSNFASQALFKSLARRHNVDCEITTGFPADAFATTGHEAEDLFRIGPLQHQA